MTSRVTPDSQPWIIMDSSPFLGSMSLPDLLRVPSMKNSRGILSCRMVLT